MEKSLYRKSRESCKNSNPISCMCGFNLQSSNLKNDNHWQCCQPWKAPLASGGPLGTLHWHLGPPWNAPLTSGAPLERSTGIWGPLGTLHWHLPWNAPLASGAPLERSTGIWGPLGTLHLHLGPPWNTPLASGAPLERSTGIWAPQTPSFNRACMHACILGLQDSLNLLYFKTVQPQKACLFKFLLFQSWFLWGNSSLSGWLAKHTHLLITHLLPPTDCTYLSTLLC